ncbi:hypothetical protein ACIBL3_35640 [Kribbella sp. NPDC050124]|uniref:hypothetical protein n=1 Tax=Kribbella sp. NPDC050124 TaxID=3364114 RepID=UPI0037921BB0
MNETSVDAQGRSKRSRAVALLGSAGALALVLGGVTLAMAPSASASGEIIDGNPKCEDVIPGSTEIKFDPPNPGSASAGGVTVTWSTTTLAADDPDHPGDQTGGQQVSFTATGGVVLGALMKGGPAANFYNYQPAGTTAGSGLHTPVNSNNGKYYGISHVTFCVKQVTTTPTPTPTPTDSPTDSPTPTPTDTPTDSPTPTPTDTPSDSPTPTPTDTPSDSPTPTPTDTPSDSPTPTPTDTPSDSPTPTTSPTDTATPTTSPTDTTSTPTVAIPTEVDAGQSGGLQSVSAIAGSQSAWGIALLMLGGVLVFAGVLKSRQTRGQHSA